MSLKTLTSQETVTVQTRTDTVGDQWGVSESYADASTKKCHVQEASASDIAEFQARGQRVDFVLFFSADPSIDRSNRIVWGSRYLLVTAVQKEGRPGKTLLWVVYAYETTTEREAA